MPLSLAVLVSGSGSNLQSLIDKIEAGLVDGEIKLVLSNNPDAYGLIRAQNHGIPTAVIQHTDHPNREAFDAAMLDAVADAGAESGAVVLAGFMRLLSPVFVNAFAGRLLNIHPALLPSFPGVHGQSDAADYGVKLSGCTVHFVDEKMDHGPVVIQAAVPALADDDGNTLGERILALEHRIYPQAVQWLAAGRLTIEGRRVSLAPPTEGAAAPADMSETGPCLVNPPLERGF